MLSPTAIQETPTEDYQLILEFDNGEKRIFNVEPYIQGDWYGQLRIMEYFKKAAVDGYTVTWRRGRIYARTSYIETAYC